MSLKGIILAGGNGTRLMPLTKAVNKHLLPIGDKPMLQHCVEKFTQVGITDIMVITGGEHLGGIAEFLGSGKELKCNITYRVQEGAGGIAHALALAEDFIGDMDSMCVLLGDNIFETNLSFAVNVWHVRPHNSAMILLKEVEDPERFGVATIGDGRVIKIVEKPVFPETNYAVTGIYFYDKNVFDIIRKCKPSKRGEMEITDVNNHFINIGKMKYSMLDGWWTDAGTHNSYRRANDLYNGVIPKGQT